MLPLGLEPRTTRESHNRGTSGETLLDAIPLGYNNNESMRPIPNYFTMRQRINQNRPMTTFDMDRS